MTPRQPWAAWPAHPAEVPHTPTVSNERARIDLSQWEKARFGYFDQAGRFVEFSGEDSELPNDSSPRWVGGLHDMQLLRAALAPQQEVQPAQTKLGDPSPDDLWAFYAANVGLEVKHSWGTAVAMLDAAIKKYSHTLPMEAVNSAVQTKPLTPAQRRALIDRAGDITDGLNQDDFADEIIKLVEAHHGICSTQQAEEPSGEQP